MTYTINIRPRRQATFPSEILTALGLTVGDSVEVKVVNDRAILTPKKKIALDALNEIKKAFRESKIPMSEFMDKINRDREVKAKSFGD